MARIAVFSKYFGYNVGGAERSMLAMMRALEAEGHEIVAYVNRYPRHFGAKDAAFNLPSSWEVRRFALPVDWTRFRFIEYLGNSRMLSLISESMADIDILYAYGHLAPGMLLCFPRRRVYLVRDEYGLGWNRNYYRGWRAFLQRCYFLVEAPFRMRWLIDLKRVIASSECIANSGFIASGLEALVPGAALRIIPPQLDIEALQAEYHAASALESVAKGVVAVGDNVLKGGDIFRSVARAMPDLHFYLFDRKYAAREVSGNITFMPWQSQAGALYRYAALLMVPSRINEAFGRVVIEAQLLGIPVVASHRGGLPEAIADPSMLVEAIEDPEEWVKKIRENINIIGGRVERSERNA